MMGRLRLFVRTLIYLRPGQVATRVFRVLERAWWRVSGAPAPSVAAPALRVHAPLWRGLADDAAALDRAREILAGRFTFLGQTREHVTWIAEGASRLWRFHLHYFDYARDLATEAVHRDRQGAYRAFRDLAQSWIEAHQRLGGDGWHPYTISIRVVNWCETAVVFRPELDGDSSFAGRLYDSIAAQAEFLSRHVENDVRGNHLLENARSLVRASCFFEGERPRRWLQTGLGILDREIPEQVLADGGHVERAPGYHVRVMNVLQDVAVLLRSNEAPVPGIEAAVLRMREFLEAILPPEGRLPLLKDTTSPEVPLAPSASGPSRWLDASGYAVMRDDASGDHLIADYGRVCPDDLPAHAHADLFSFELTIGGHPVVVDSGAFEYAEGEWRTWFRSTAAHNTVGIDGRDQSEMWGSFRVGRRARVRDVVWIRTSALTAIDGLHDGYAPVLHRRTIVALHEPRLWIVLDRISGPPGHEVRTFIHLHPEHPQLAYAPFGAVAVTESSGWYSEHFGVKRANRVIVLTAASPAVIGYVIAADEPPVVRIDGTAVHLETVGWKGTVAFGDAVTLT
jgi:uncharacterized heparinase superfamily protein